MLRLISLFILVLAAEFGCPWIVAQNRAQEPAAADSQPSARDEQARNLPPSALRIGTGDLLLITIFGVPEFNSETRVAEDGTISLPLLGKVAAAGMTAQDFASDLTLRLIQGRYFKNPQVSVLIKEFATQGVSVLGEVRKPGVYPLLGPRTLFDVISAAEGITSTAGNTVTIVHRDRPHEPATITLAFGENGFRQSNVPVLPGDTVVVNRAGLVYVIGEVQKPTEIVLANPNLTALQAIAIAQGVTPRATLNKARIVRTTPEGRAEIALPLKKMLAGELADVKLQANDIVYIPGGITKGAAKRGLEMALQTVTGMAVWGRY